MARKFLTSIDLQKNELQNARIQNLSGAPSSPVNGQLYYDTSTNILYYFNGQGWVNMGGTNVGTYAGRPAATSANANSFFYASDNHLIYFSNGSTWQQVDSFGSSVVSETSYGQSSAVGTSTDYARADHTHGTPPLTNTAATAITETTSTVGTGTAPAREDHVHDFTPANFPVSHFGQPVANTPWNSYKITNLADPTNAQDAATKNYVDGVAQGLNVHDEVDAATTANIVGTYTAGSADASNGTGIGAYFVVTATGALVVDGVTLALNSRVLLKNQTDGKQNGVYKVTTAGATGVSAVLTRATDANNHVPGQVTAGDFVYIVNGTVQGTTGWVQTAQGTATTPTKGIKLGTDSITFSQFYGVGTYTASNGVLLTGTNFTFAPSTTGGLTTGVAGGAVLLPSTSGLKTDSNGLALNPTSTGGLTTSSSGTYILLQTNSGLATTSSGLAVTPGLGITTTAQGAAGAATTNQVAINTDVVVRKYATTIGDGSTTSITITHNLNTRDITAAIYDASTYAEVMCDVTHTTVNTVTFAFSVAPSTNASDLQTYVYTGTFWKQLAGSSGGGGGVGTNVAWWLGI